MKHIAAAAVLLAWTLGGAQAHEISEAYSACLEKAAGKTSEMQDCIAAELVLQDRRLSAAYDVLMKSPKVTDERRTQLRDVQRKWSAFRDANCAYYDDASLGPMARLAAKECVLTTTVSRAFELENLRPE